MQLLSPDPDSPFPPLSEASEEPDGLLAMGGDLSITRLLNAYQQGIFPWYGWQEPILWWSPNPRLVLFPRELHVSRSMKKFRRKTHLEFRLNTDFSAVIQACAEPREDGLGTWIVPDMIEAYTALHRAGWAHSAEVYDDGRLVGGLYGIALDRVFFGESMFSRTPNASKLALICLTERLLADGFELIDCQVDSAHLRSLGACLIDRDEFQARLLEWCSLRPWVPGSPSSAKGR